MVKSELLSSILVGDEPRSVLEALVHLALVQTAVPKFLSPIAVPLSKQPVTLVPVSSRDDQASLPRIPVVLKVALIKRAISVSLYSEAVPFAVQKLPLIRGPGELHRFS